MAIPLTTNHIGRIKGGRVVRLMHLYALGSIIPSAYSRAYYHIFILLSVLVMSPSDPPFITSTLPLWVEGMVGPYDSHSFLNASLHSLASHHHLMFVGWMTIFNCYSCTTNHVRRHIVQRVAGMAIIRQSLICVFGQIGLLPVWLVSCQSLPCTISGYECQPWFIK
eukprot:6193739-Pleurochrysis_carterae.AAC.5